MTFKTKSQQPPALVPNLQAKANKIAKDVMSQLNGTTTPQNDTPTLPSISSSMKTRPSPPIRISSKTKPSNISNVMNLPTRTGHTSGHSRGDHSSKIDTTTSKASGSATDIDATPVDRREPNETFETENTQPTYLNDTKRSDSVVHVGRVETTLVKGKPKDMKAPAQA